MKCDKCLHSRGVVSENGYHSICCLDDDIVRECLSGSWKNFMPNSNAWGKSEVSVIGKEVKDV